MLDQYTLNLARQAWKAQDYNLARQYYQQLSYGYNNFTELEKEAFTKEVAEFAKADPIYHEILQLVKNQIILEKAPVLQSRLTNAVKLDHGEQGVELLRYVLYYASYNDDIIRTKKGRSYLLQLPVKENSVQNIDQIKSINPHTTKTVKKVQSKKNNKTITTLNKTENQDEKIKTSWQKFKDEFNRPLTTKEKILGAFVWIAIFLIIVVLI